MLDMLKYAGHKLSVNAGPERNILKNKIIMRELLVKLKIIAYKIYKTAHFVLMLLINNRYFT